MAPAIRETVLPVFDNPNEATVERVSAVVHHRDSAHENFSSAIDNTQHKTRTQKGDISNEVSMGTFLKIFDNTYLIS